MTVVSTHRDPDALTMTFVTEFDAPVERVWQVWEDPRQLERWWGPPSWPATFDEHDFRVGGWTRYHMTGPQGERSHGWWRITELSPPYRLEFDDGFADAQGDPVDAMGTTHGRVTLESANGRTRMTVVSAFESPEQLEQMLTMGMEEGMRAALEQVDEVLAD